MASARPVDTEETTSDKISNTLFRVGLLETERELHYAIKHKDARAFIDLLNEDVDTSTTFSHDPPLISLIQHVVQENFLEGIEFLLSNRNSKTRTDRDNAAYYNAFTYAVNNDMIDVVRVYLISSLKFTPHSDYNTVSKCTSCFDVRSILSTEDIYWYAMKTGQYDIAARAVEHSTFKVNNQHSKKVEPALHVAVRVDQASLGNVLILKGAKLDAMDRRGATALAVACANQSYNCCVLLLRHGANPNHDSYNVLSKSPLYALLIRLTYEPHTVSPETICVIDNVIELFVLTGMHITEEAHDFVLYAESQIGSILAKLGNVKFACRRPTSLSMSCKCFIRNDLLRLTDGASIVERVNRLSLPSHVKNQLMIQQNE